MTPDHRWTLRHFQAAGMNDDDAETAVKAALRDRIRDEGYVMDADTLERGEAVPVVLDADADGGWREVKAGETSDGQIVTWSVGGTERHRDEQAVTATHDEHGAVADVPEPVRRAGGGLRVRHNLGGPVTVGAYNAQAHKIGYLFAQPIDDNEEHVELLPGAYRLRVMLDDVEE